MKNSIFFISTFFVLCLPVYAQDAPEEILARVLNLRHGLELASFSEDPDLLAIQQSPATYLPIIQSDLVYPATLDLNSYSEFVQRATALIDLLRYLDIEDSKATLASIYLEAAEDLDALEISYKQLLEENNPTQLLETSQLYSSVMTVHSAVLSSLTDLNDDRVLDHVKSRLGVINDPGIRLAIIKYNNKVNETEPLVSESFVVNGDWQLYGLHLNPVDAYFDAIFYKPLLEQEPYTWDGLQYVPEDTLVLGKGYWINADEPGAEVIVGAPHTVITRNLLEGWNLISPPNCTPNDFHRYQINDENNIVFFDLEVYGYGENGYYLSGDYLNAGQGYWIQLENGGTYTLDCNLPIGSKRGYSPPPIPDSFSILSVQDAAGGNQELYFGGTLPDDFQASFSMPPRPFEGSFDARLAGDTRLTEEEAARIRIQARQYPLTIQLTDIPGESSSTYILEEIVGGQVVATRPIVPGTPLQVTNEQVSILRVRPE